MFGCVNAVPSAGDWRTGIVGAEAVSILIFQELDQALMFPAVSLERTAQYHNPSERSVRLCDTAASK